jgi:hypothetical protein
MRLDQPPPTREYESLGRERAWEPATVERSSVAPEPVQPARHDAGRRYDPLSDPLPEPARHESPAYDGPLHDGPRHGGTGYGSTAYEPDRYEPSAWRDELDGDAGEGAASPLEWLADHSLLHPLDQPWTTPTAAVPASGPADRELPETGPVAAHGPRPVPFRRRHADEPADPAHATTTDQPAHRAGQRPPLPAYGTPPPQPDTAGHGRLSEILAEGGAPPAAGRRRRRYREDDETDDVLSRVLRGE